MDPNYIRMRFGYELYKDTSWIHASWIQILLECELDPCELDPNYIRLRVGSMRVESELYYNAS